jgi:hypothetical protein
MLFQKIDLNSPVNSSPRNRKYLDYYRKHAGGGKAEQIFLRGFDRSWNRHCHFGRWNASEYGFACTWSRLCRFALCDSETVEK